MLLRHISTLKPVSAAMSFTLTHQHLLPFHLLQTGSKFNTLSTI